MDRRRFASALLAAGSSGIALGKPRRGQEVATPLDTRTQPDAPPHPPPLRMPDKPTSVGPSSSWYLGAFELDTGSYYDKDGFDYLASYSRKTKLPANPRLCLFQHPSGGWKSVGRPYAPQPGFDIECSTQDGQAKGIGAERWGYGRNGLPYPQRRNAAVLSYLANRYPNLDIDDKGIMVYGNSMGSGGILATWLLPAPWRSKIAYVRGKSPVFMYRYLNSSSYPTLWPKDQGDGDPIWDAVDFAKLAVSDQITRGMHFRESFATNDTSGRMEGNQSAYLLWLKICYEQKISAVATYTQGGHSWNETGYNLPSVQLWETEEQDVTLDRAHPCFTSSTGNWPVDPSNILNIVNYPRGHYNLGLIWDHERIVDTAHEVIFPIKYRARAAFGGDIPDQPARITVDVTPRRPRRFTLSDGERIYWTLEGGVVAGTAVVSGDVVTAVGVPLVSGEPFRRLRFFKKPA